MNSQDPDIKGLVERLRNNATDCLDDSRWATPELAPLLSEAADALERLSTPPAVPATPVALTHETARIAAEAIKDYADNNLSMMEACDMETTKANQLYRAAKSLFEMLEGKFAAPVPVTPVALGDVLRRMDTQLDAIWDTNSRKEEIDGLVKLKNIVRAALAAPVPAHSDVREAITEEMIERALSAWFASPPSETDQGLARSMRAALNAALSTTAQSGDQK